MYQRLQVILSFLFVLFLSASAFAQVHIGEGVTITDGTTFVITNQDIVIDTDEIKGEGKLIISHDEEQKITVKRNVRSEANIEVNADKIAVNERVVQHFALENLPPLTEKIIAKVKEKKVAQQALPVRHINYEGLTYTTKDESDDQHEEVISSLPKDVHHGIMISEVMPLQAAEFNNDYLLPIYSITLNDERFSNYAELYEFESLTAIFKPPIV